MNCHEAAPLISAFADGEIDRVQSRDIKTHLQGCPDCGKKHQDILDLRSRLRAEVPYFPAPPALRARIGDLARTTSTRSPDRVEGGRWRWLLSGAFAGCAATVLAWIVGTSVLTWRASEDFVAQAVQAHVRAALNNHLIEVASSDQHTVKPWLSARLDYSPPVPDLSSDGFTLTGGRLEYLAGHPVATLVYRYRDHTIDVFVRPESSGAPPSAPRTVRGFNAAHATGSGMTWLAVSDLNPEALAGFVGRIARGPAP
jgi:anti-sigma factor RsiW